jgi:hypothetical protein
MKKLTFSFLGALLLGVSLASFAGAARADTAEPAPVSNLANMRHEMLKAVANNLRG